MQPETPEEPKNTVVGFVAACVFVPAIMFVMAGITAWGAMQSCFVIKRDDEDDR